MTLKEISNIRILSQRIGATEFKTAGDVVGWMGAMQAQDYSMAKWAIGIRMSDSTDKRIESSLDKGEIIRTHLMRPTWHFVSAKDIYWMLDLSAQKIKSSMRSNHKELELSESIFTKSSGIIEKALANRKSLTREEVGEEFNKAKIRTDGNRLSHLLTRAELDGLICSGPRKDNKITYALLRERVPAKNVFTREESLFELAKRYFTSHCPATLQDFVWWSGLSVNEARRALELVKSGFITEIISSEKYIFPNSSPVNTFGKTSVFLLPSFDEFLISYKDRSASLSLVNNRKTVSSNGIFYPVVVVNGQVAGLWKRTLKKNKVIIEPAMFQKHDKTSRNKIEKAASGIGHFLNKEIEVRFNS